MPQKLKQTQYVSLENNLRELKNRANLTQEQAIAQLQLRNFSISRSAYSQIEAGTYNIHISALNCIG
ncbi:helix-turn-helix transcriptional regulator [Bariatricus massiliensis]|uniref:helix-turn-helix domain-containing protein n=1 Tax=Bariatricus massiliensis TaxID=1745713 RepID=UPI000A8E7F6A